MNLPDFSVTWAYTRGGLYTGSFGSRGFRGAYTRGGGLYTEGLILGVLRYLLRINHILVPFLAMTSSLARLRSNFFTLSILRFTSH